MKNLQRIQILSNNLCEEVSDPNDNLRVITEKIDPTHMGVVINKHDIVATTYNKGV